MYQEHRKFRQPDDENIKVWRYMDFTKFVSLINTQKLYFTRADIFKDPFEGSWPLKNIELRKKLYTGRTKSGQKMSNDEVSKMIESYKLHNAINCWHANEYESSAMWSLYLKCDEGVAIQTTYNRLKESIIDNEKVFLGNVTYIDYETESIYQFSKLVPFFHKRKCFEHEREVRAIVNFKKEILTDGLQISVDLENLIQNLYVPPNSSKWFFELVKNEVIKFGYAFKVKQSSMDSIPLF